MSSDVVNLPNIATQLGSSLGIGSIGGSLLMSFIFMFMFLIPTFYLCNKRNMDTTLPTLFVGGGTLIASVLMFGCPAWVVILIMLLTGALWAGMTRNWLSGRGN